MFFKLFIIFTIIPVIELSILIKIGSSMGVLNTILLVTFTALLGAYLVRMEGVGVITRFQNNMANGIFPAEELLDGAMILVAGALLITPGIVTDIIGFLLVFPVSRQMIKQFLRVYIQKKISASDIRIHKL